MDNKIAPETKIGAEPRPERVRLLKIPIDIVEPDDLGLLLFHMAGKQREQHMILLSLWDLLRARRNAEYRRYVEGADLVIPISKSIVRGAKFLLGKRPIRYMPFDFIIRCMSALEEHEFSCYLLGGKKRVLLKIEKNIVSTFPRLRIVGRFPGSFRRQEEPPVISAIRKASPSLLLVGRGVRGGEFWIARNSGRLGNGIKLWCSDLFDVLDGRKWRPSRGVFDFGLEWVGYCVRNPLKLFRVFPFLHYNFLLLVYAIFGKKKPSGETVKG